MTTPSSAAAPSSPSEVVPDEHHASHADDDSSPGTAPSSPRPGQKRARLARDDEDDEPDAASPPPRAGFHHAAAEHEAGETLVWPILHEPAPKPIDWFVAHHEHASSQDDAMPRSSLAFTGGDGFRDEQHPSPSPMEDDGGGLLFSASPAGHDAAGSLDLNQPTACSSEDDASGALDLLNRPAASPGDGDALDLNQPAAAASPVANKGTFLVAPCVQDQPAFEGCRRHWIDFLGFGHD